MKMLPEIERILLFSVSISKLEPQKIVKIKTGEQFFQP